VFGGSLRKRAGALLVDGFFRGVAKAGSLHPRARPERHGVEVIRDLAYTSSDRLEHQLDIYRPRGDGPWPVVMYMHGGGFRVLSKDTHWIMGLAFARRGYLVFNVGYRLAPEHRFPAAVEDVSDAYGWIARNAASYGGDLGRLVLAGESAGANLATGLALASAYERNEPWARAVWDTAVVPRAVVAACGILQVTDPERFRRRKARLSRFIADRLEEVTESYLGHGVQHAPGPLDFADPLVALERGVAPARPLPAFFVPVGTKDPLLDDTRRLAAALERLGVRVEARYYRGEMHAFHAFVFLENARRCWGDIYAFLDSALAPEVGSSRVDAGLTA